MKYALLEMVQDVLSSMDSDEVNSISDTTEAQQVARVIRACYFDVISNDIPDTTTLFQLEASGDSSKPVIMFAPDDVHNILFLKYNRQLITDTTSNFKLLTPLSVQEFFRLTQTFTLSDTTVSSMNYTIDSDTFEFLYRIDKAPDYYTCIDNVTFVFDSIDKAVDTTLQKTKTMCLGEKETSFLLEDTYIIDLNEKEHVWLLNEAKSLAFQELKQMTHQKAEQTAKRQRIKAQKRKYVSNPDTVYYNGLNIYGRPRNSTSSPAVIMH